MQIICHVFFYYKRGLSFNFKNLKAFVQIAFTYLCLNLRGVRGRWLAGLGGAWGPTGPKIPIPVDLIPEKLKLLRHYEKSLSLPVGSWWGGKTGADFFLWCSFWSGRHFIILVKGMNIFTGLMFWYSDRQPVGWYHFVPFKNCFQRMTNNAFYS